MKRGATLTYLHHDHLGSLVSATDANGNEVASARYWPFGALRTSTGTLPTDRLFTGQTRDLGDDRLYFYNARYYDATIGKFLSPDTAQPAYNDNQSLNAYSYTRNNPLRFVDPSGHAVEDWFNEGWVGEFREAHGGADPTAEDYAYRFFTMALAQLTWDMLTDPTSLGKGGIGWHVPPGLSLETNLAYVEQQGLMKILHFADLVRPGGEWDFKRLDPDYADFANFQVLAAYAGGSKQLHDFIVGLPTYQALYYRP